MGRFGLGKDGRWKYRRCKYICKYIRMVTHYGADKINIILTQIVFNVVIRVNTVYMLD